MISDPHDVEHMASPIRGTGAPRALELRAWALLLVAGLPDPAVAAPRPDGALHLIWRRMPAVLKMWVRTGNASSWEVMLDGRRLAGGYIRYEGDDPRGADVQRLRRAIERGWA